MTRTASTLGDGLLYGLHADGCTTSAETDCQPVVVPAGGDEEPTYFDHERGARIEVVIMAWCPNCHAAEWGLV